MPGDPPFPQQVILQSVFADGSVERLRLGGLCAAGAGAATFRWHDGGIGPRVPDHALIAWVTPLDPAAGLPCGAQQAAVDAPTAPAAGEPVDHAEVRGAGSASLTVALAPVVPAP